MKVFVLFVVATIVVALPCHGSSYQRAFPLRMKPDNHHHHHGYGDTSPDVWCASWRLAVEAQNIFGFKTIPEECIEPNKEYVQGEQYRSDSKTVNQQAFFYARDLEVGENDVFIFSIDGTVLSNIPYYEQHEYGAERFNSTAYDEWVNEGEAPALPETLKNYNKLVSLGFKIVFLSGRYQDKKHVTEANLKKAGFHTWEKLILRDPRASSPNAVEYKSSERRKLERQGYRIVGIIGDQWSDLKGHSNGDRTFKLPNPLYYIE